MGFRLKIKLKDSVNADEMNSKLAFLNLEDKYLPAFQGKEYHTWNIVDYYNQSTEEAKIAARSNDQTQEDLNQIRLRATGGEDRPATYEEYEKIFGMWMLINTLEIDISFGRCSEQSMVSLVQFVLENHDSIEWIDHGADLLERCGLDIEESTIKLFDSLVEPEEEPEMLPEAKRTSRDIQGGIPLRYWGSGVNKKVYAVFGNVDTPTFMKDKIYKDDLLNNLYRTDSGHAVLLLPLCDLSENFHEKVWASAMEMGVLESYAVFNALCYSSTLEGYHGGENIVGVADALVFNTYEDIEETFVYLLKKARTSTFEFKGNKRYEPFVDTKNKHSFTVSVLNSLYYRMKKLNRDKAYSMVTEVLAHA